MILKQIKRHKVTGIAPFCVTLPRKSKGVFMKKVILSLSILFSTASVYAQVSLAPGGSVTLGNITVTCGGDQNEKPTCWCKPVGNQNDFIIMADYSNGMTRELGRARYQAVCDMQIANNSICKK